MDAIKNVVDDKGDVQFSYFFDVNNTGRAPNKLETSSCSLCCFSLSSSSLLASSSAFFKASCLPKTITRSIGGQQDDLTHLIEKGYVIVFEDGTVAIRSIIPPWNRSCIWLI